MANSYLTVPVHLQNLFDMMDFIGNAKTGMKPCFNGKYYVSSDSWTGALYRMKDGEKQSTRGNDIVRKCCQDAAQSYEQYKSTEFGPIILDKMIKLRTGILAIKSTYEIDDTEIQTCSHLSNSILELDRKIPHEVLVANGIVPPPAGYGQAQVERVSQTTQPIPISGDVPKSPPQSAASYAASYGTSPGMRKSPSQKPVPQSLPMPQAISNPIDLGPPIQGRTHSSRSPSVSSRLGSPVCNDKQEVDKLVREGTTPTFTLAEFTRSTTLDPPSPSEKKGDDGGDDGGVPKGIDNRKEEDLEGNGDGGQDVDGDDGQDEDDLDEDGDDDGGDVKDINQSLPNGNKSNKGKKKKKKGKR